MCSGPYLREDGVEIEQDLVRQVDQIISGVLEDCERFCESGIEPDEIPNSIGEYLKLKFNEYMDSCLLDSLEERQMKEELFDWHIR